MTIYTVNRTNTWCHLLITSAVTVGMEITGLPSLSEIPTKQWLFVHTADEAQVESSTVLIMPAGRDILGFTDRPYREQFYLTPQDYVSLWGDNADKNLFKADPPNAVLTWVDAHGKVSEEEMVIEQAILQDQMIVYTIAEELKKRVVNNPSLGSESISVERIEV